MIIEGVCIIQFFPGLLLEVLELLVIPIRLIVVGLIPRRGVLHALAVIVPCILTLHHLSDWHQVVALPPLGYRC